MDCPGMMQPLVFLLIEKALYKGSSKMFHLFDRWFKVNYFNPIVQIFVKIVDPFTKVFLGINKCDIQIKFWRLHYSVCELSHFKSDMERKLAVLVK